MWSRLNFLGRPFKVLAIETSCDDTCVAILDSAKNILAETTIKQHKIHEQFKGIVPHLASRAHKINLPRALEKTFNSANLRLSNIDAIAVTRGPGIGGCLTIGYQCGLNLAAASDIPFIPVNHMEAHALTPRFDNNLKFPFLCLLVSGGHTMIIWAKELGQYSIMGSTLDESVGEAIDKAACIIGFNYDSEYGPAASLVKAASGVIKSRFTLPSFSVSSKIQHGLDFSFSGLRTALSNLCKSEPHFHEQNIKNELASSFIKSCTDQLSLKLLKCINLLSKSGENINTVVISGGVACNDLVYNDLRAKLSNENINLIRPGHKQHCTDNAMMIAWTAIEYIKTNTHTLNYLDVDPEWSLTNMKLDLHKSYRISNENPNVML